MAVSNEDVLKIANLPGNESTLLQQLLHFAKAGHVARMEDTR